MIFLQILKIIGIILLVLIGLIIFILILILFDPVFYRLKGNVDSNKPDLDLKVHWIFHIIYANAFYKDGDFKVYCRILHKKIYLFGYDETKENAKSEENITEEAKEDSIEEWENVGSIANEDVEESSDNIPEDNSLDENETTKKSLSEKLEDKWKETKKKYRKFKRNYRRYKRIILDEKNHDAVKHLCRETINLIKIILPRRFKLLGTYSVGAPDKTAYVIGILSMFPFSHQKDFKLIPDFESDKTYFHGDFDIKGRVYVYKIVIILIRVLFDKKCRRMYNMIKKLK